MISLGCAKNLVDAEIMLGSLLKSGIEITNDAEQADALIVNTCSFIDSAQEESVDTILESVELRDVKPAWPGRHRFRLPLAALPRRTPPSSCLKWTRSWESTRVALVGEISSNARCKIARKGFEVGSQKPEGGKIIGRLNELEKNRDISAHEKEEFIRGSEKLRQNQNCRRN